MLLRLSATRVLAALAALAVVGLCVIVLAAWSGVYNVAASRGHWAVVDLFLRFAMRNSVQAHAPDIQPPRLDDADLVRLGAGHFYGGCAYCHGAPGTPINPISQSMLPPPPVLREQLGLWTDQELFWIIKHGIKYAGMPAWVAQDRDDEVWALVAFLRRLPGLDPQAYLALALGDVAIEPPNGRRTAIGQRSTNVVEACGRCHGFDDRPPDSALVPRLHGQSRDMLFHALQAYASGERHSGIMQPIAIGLSQTEMRELADYYSGLPAPPRRDDAPAQGALLEAGERLALQGDEAAEIPACLSCHGAAALPIYPRLAAQHAPYMANQLRAWQRGPKGRTATDAIMAPIARRLSEQQIVALSAYFASLPADAPDTQGARKP